MIVEKFGQKYERVFADDIKTLTKDLFRKIRADGYKPDCVIALARGGSMQARYLSDYCDQRKFLSIRIEYYTDENKRDKEPKITQGLPPETDLSGQSVMLVDDVSDTGDSLNVAVEHVKGFKPKDLKTAVLYFKPESSTFVPDYYARETDAWIIFDWEQYETGKSLIKRKMRHMEDKEVRKHLEDLSIEKEIIDWLIEDRTINHWD